VSERVWRKEEGGRSLKEKYKAVSFGSDRENWGKKDVEIAGREATRRKFQPTRPKEKREKKGKSSSGYRGPRARGVGEEASRKGQKGRSNCSASDRG